jgi:glycosyltransferase involved in cell wall biosynthesis
MKPLIVVKFTHSLLSGGYKRLYEILKRGKFEDITYVIVTDSTSFENAAKIFPDFPRILKEYKVFIRKNSGKNGSQLPVLKQAYSYKRILSLGLSIYRVAKRENVDLIISPSEGLETLAASYLASVLCSKPFTAIFQPTSYLFQSSSSTEPLNPLNALSHVNTKTPVEDSLLSKIGFSIDLLSLLKIAEKTVLLTVSKSVSKELARMNPRLEFITITPGNGIDSVTFSVCSREHSNQQRAIFFARLIQEKGIFDLIDIWKEVIKKLPNAKLTVCGIEEKPEVLTEFLNEISNNNLNGNIEFLGQLDETKLFGLIANSYLTVYPSYVDSFSLVTLESLACGTPVIAYDLPAIKTNFG